MALQSESTNAFPTNVHSVQCPTEKEFMISFSRYGRTNNNLIQLSNMMVFSRQSHTMLCVPPFMTDLVHMFDISKAQRFFCIRLNCTTPLQNVLNDSISFRRRHTLFRGITYRERQHALALLLRYPKPSLLRLVQPFCNITAAVHVRHLEGGCNRRMQQHFAGRDIRICSPNPAFVRQSLRHCSLHRIFVASDRQRPQIDKQLLNHFDNAVSYRGPSDVLVDLMVLTIANSKHCAVLNAASTFTRNAIFMRANAKFWCGV